MHMPLKDREKLTRKVNERHFKYIHVIVNSLKTFVLVAAKTP